MKIGIDDVKQIINKVTQGGGSNFTPLEIELAKMVVKYRQTIGRLADEKAKTFDSLYKVYSAIHSIEFSADLMHKHAAEQQGAFCAGSKTRRRTKGIYRQWHQRK